MRWMAAAAVALALGGAGYYFVYKKTPPPAYRTEKIVRGDIISAITASGAINAEKTVQVGAQVSGIIRRLHVDFNSRVKKGDLIAEMDQSLFLAQLEQQKAALAVAQANQEKAQAALADAERINRRTQALHSKGVASADERDAAQVAAQGAAAQLAAAKAAVEQQKAALSMAEANLKYTKIAAPVDGVVILRAVDEGQTVASSFQTPTLFTIAADLARMQIDANVNEADIGAAREGMKAAFNVDAFPGESFEGVVAQVRNFPVTVQNVVTYDVVIRVDNTAMKLKPGMTANVSIITASKEGILKAPNAAFRYRPKGMEKETVRPGQKGMAIWILEKGAPKRVTVKTGAGDGSHTEVISDELKEGMEVITGEAVDGKNAQAAGARGRGPRLY